MYRHKQHYSFIPVFTNHPWVWLCLSYNRTTVNKPDKAHCHMELTFERLHSDGKSALAWTAQLKKRFADGSHPGSSSHNPHPFLKELVSFSLAFVCNVRFQIWGWEGYGLWNAVTSCGMSILSLLLWGDSQGIEAAQSEPVPPDRKAITWATNGKPCYLQVIPVLTGLSCHTW